MDLPVLREELSLHAGPAEEGGAPSWLIRDPIRNRHFRIGWLAFEILRRWGLGDPEAIASAVDRETTLAPTAADVAAVAEFLAFNQLTRPLGHRDTERLARRAEAERPSWYLWLLHQLPVLSHSAGPSRPVPGRDAAVGAMAGRADVSLGDRCRLAARLGASPTSMGPVFGHADRDGIACGRGQLHGRVGRREGRSRIGARIHGSPFRVPGFRPWAWRSW